MECTREGEQEADQSRTSRFYETEDGWYLRTREGISVGPYSRKFDAQLAASLLSPVLDQVESPTETITANRLVGPACVLDCSADVAADPDFLLTPAWIEEWESEHGRIPPGSWLLMRTDWSKRQGTEAVLNIDENGPHSPGFQKEASELLAKDRGVLGVGVETIGTDAGQAGGFDPPFPNHTVMHGAGKLGLASLCNLDQLPATGAVVFAGPLKIVEGSGSPLRVLALA